MKKGKIFEGTVEGLEFPNKGILHTDGVRAVVKNVIPGQRIRAAAGKKRNGRVEGRLLKVLEPSPMETEQDVCAHFGSCGGCLFQTVPYEMQLELKTAMVRELLGDDCPDSVFEGIKGSPLPAGYRNKMEYSFGDEVKDGPLTLGLHKRGSFHDIITVEDCRIADGDFKELLLKTLELCRKEELPFYRKLRHTGYLRHLLVRKAWKTGEILTALVTSGQVEEAFGGADREESLRRESAFLERFADALRALPLKGRLAGILHIRNDSLADVVQSDGIRVLWGQDHFYEELLGLKFKITPFSFFQTNSAGAEVLYSAAREYVGDVEGSLVYDLYSGTGTISQILAPVARKVIGVEIVEEAVRAARENAALNGLANCEFLAGDVLKVLDHIEERPDFIVLDPPRDGIHPKAMPKIISYGVDRILYISCKASSLARDLKLLTAGGYRPERVCLVDMFPGTANIETVVLLSKGEVDSKKIRVEFSLEDMDMSEFQDGATYPQIKEYVLEHTGLKVSNLYISQIKRKCGIEVGKNYNLPKSEDSRQPQCPPEKEKAIREAFKYFGMI